MNKSITKLISKNRELFWDINNNDLDSLDEEAVIERFMAYGDMNDIRELEAIIPVKNLLKTFDKIKNKKRVNLEPETINFFNIYLSKYET